MAALPGVAAAARSAEAALQRLHRLPANLRGWPRTAAAAAVRSARLSAALEADTPGDVPLPVVEQRPQHRSPPQLSAVPRLHYSDESGDQDQPALEPAAGSTAGALRVAAALPDLVSLWSRAPLQVLARLHVLAASALEPAVPTDRRGRPSSDSAAQALAQVAALVLGASWPAVITAGAVQALLVRAAAFGTADGVVARAASRLTLMAATVDPRGLSVPEVGLWSQRSIYRATCVGFADGSDGGRTDWLLLFAGAVVLGAQEGERLSKPQ